jgi:hypothetical protein
MSYRPTLLGLAVLDAVMRHPSLRGDLEALQAEYAPVEPQDGPDHAAAFYTRAAAETAFTAPLDA